jgi:hypothetical protein
MKKKISLLFVLCLFVSQSCMKSSDPFTGDDNLKPDDPIAVELPEVNIPLVTSVVTITNKLNDIQVGSKFSEQFEYDKKNRIIKYDFHDGVYVYTYKYDVANRVSEGLSFSASAQQKNIYHKGWVDFNKNGKMDVFEDPSQTIDKRVADLLSQMTVDEKTCQMATLYGYKRVLKDEMPIEPTGKRDMEGWYCQYR